MFLALRFVGFILAFGCLAQPVAPAAAQQFPAKLVRFVVPQTPGGATDDFARKIRQDVERAVKSTGVPQFDAAALEMVGVSAVPTGASRDHRTLVYPARHIRGQAGDRQISSL